MATIDIVTTATIRPEILDKTYKSFVDNLFLDRSCFRLIINVDPAGDKHRTQQDVLNIAKKYFSDIIYNFPIDPCFTKSVKWLWANTQSTYVFHLEDDWTINQRIDINDMISILDKYPKICSVRLSKGHIVASRKVIDPIPCPYIQKEDVGKFLLFPRISFNPTLFRGVFVRNASAVMTDYLNPESQLVKKFARRKEVNMGKDFNSSQIEDFITKWDHSVLNTKHSVVRDIGTQWRNSMGISRKYDFMFWK